MNINFDVTGLLTSVEVTLMSDRLGCLSWQERRGGSVLIAHNYT